MLRYVMALLSGLLLSACSVFGVRSGTEEPRYDVVASLGTVEIRSYVARIAAETTIEQAGGEEAARSAGFRRVAGYIFGANAGRAKIAMTAPVAQEAGGGEKIAMTAPVAQARDAGGASVIRFFMPREYTLESLPVPDDKAVRLVAVPPQTMAVLRFTGSTGADAVNARKAELLAALPTREWRAAGEPVAWFYDPPWTLPWLRRNEVAVPVAAN